LEFRQHLTLFFVGVTASVDVFQIRSISHNTYIM